MALILIDWEQRFVMESQVIPDQDGDSARGGATGLRWDSGREKGMPTSDVGPLLRPGELVLRQFSLLRKDHRCGRCFQELLDGAP